MPLTSLTDYSPEELGADIGTDGPCLLADGSFALFVSLRGRDGGTMPTASELRWRRDVPARMRSEPVHALLRRGHRALCLGRATFERTGHPQRDGFKILFRLAEPLPEATWRALVAAANEPPPPAPEEEIAKLTALSSMAHRVSAMRVFVERWYGSSADGPALDPAFPTALRELHVLAANRLIVVHNALIGPSDLAFEGGKLTFCVENQGVCAWAVDASSDDPPVFVRGGSSSDPWRAEAPKLSEFLLQLLIYEAVLGAPFTAGDEGVREADVRKLKRHVAALDMPRWSSSKARFLGSNGIVGVVTPNADRFDVRLGARDRERFEPIEDLVSEWSDVGF